jgi:hypothetical protein
MTDNPAPKHRRGRGKPFPKGTSGNPAGKPKGTLNATTILLSRLMESEAEEVVRSVIDAAKAGDMAAAKILVDRLVPQRKGAPTPFDLPDISGVTGVGAALDAVLRAVASGELTPEEAGALGGLLEARRRTWESEEVERRLSAIEARQGASE